MRNQKKKNQKKKNDGAFIFLSSIIHQTPVITKPYLLTIIMFLKGICHNLIMINDNFPNSQYRYSNTYYLFRDNYYTAERRFKK